jgi:HSP20 family protein
MKLTPSAIILTFDLPLVEKKGISVTSTATTVEVEAQLKAPARVRAGWTVHKSVRFLRYKSHIRLPLAVTADEAKATFRNGLLTVRLPTATPGTKVRVR